MNVTKSDIAWVAIRIVGILFAAKALYSLLELGTNYYYMLQAQEGIAWGAESDRNTSQVIGLLLRSGIFFAVYSGVSVYFLVKGKFVHKLVMSTSKEDET